MSLNSCPGCVVVLNQQHEQNISHQNQCQDVALSHTQNNVKNQTVVENGRVVVKPLEPQIDETSK
ncbi:MAG: hypothetical protein KME23_10725 [Goleter apudmare HA4340-LM2]|jgi:hypothetical protein|nr:hypothetical protein [Goleter apudmare HA4340-LM2]